MAKTWGKHKWLRKRKLCKIAYAVNTPYGQGMLKISNSFWDRSQSDPTNYLQARMVDLPHETHGVGPECEVQDCETARGHSSETWQPLHWWLPVSVMTPGTAWGFCDSLIHLNQVYFGSYYTSHCFSFAWVRFRIKCAVLNSMPGRLVTKQTNPEELIPRWLWDVDIIAELYQGHLYFFLNSFLTLKWPLDSPAQNSNPFQWAQSLCKTCFPPAKSKASGWNTEFRSFFFSMCVSVEEKKINSIMQRGG